MVKEQYIVKSIVSNYKSAGLKVVTEVANFRRSADIALIDEEDNVVIIECKVSDIRRAILQSKTHRLSADRVYIGTIYRNTKSETIERLKKAGLGLIYVYPDGSVISNVIEPQNTNPWKPARERLKTRILGSNCD